MGKSIHFTGHVRHPIPIDQAALRRRGAAKGTGWPQLTPSPGPGPEDGPTPGGQSAPWGETPLAPGLDAGFIPGFWAGVGALGSIPSLEGIGALDALEGLEGLEGPNLLDGLEPPCLLDEPSEPLTPMPQPTPLPPEIQTSPAIHPPAPASPLSPQLQEAIDLLLHPAQVGLTPALPDTSAALDPQIQEAIDILLGPAGLDAPSAPSAPSDDTVLPDVPIRASGGGGYTRGGGSGRSTTEGLDTAPESQYNQDESPNPGIQSLFERAAPGRRTKGKTTQYILPGNYEKAVEDFYACAPSQVYQQGDTTIGLLADGRYINVRPSSSQGYITVDIYDPTTGRHIKFRYTEEAP